MSSPLRVGIAGYGLAGRYFHAPLLKGCGFEVAAIVTNNSQRQDAARHDFPKVQVVSDYADLLAMGLDLIVIATGNVAHAPEAIAAMHAGIPVVVDKPMALDAGQTAEVIAVSKATGIPVSVFFNRLWDSDSLTIKKALSEGVLGKVFRLDSRFERFRPDANVQSWRENLPPADGGGNLLDLQPHLISLALDWFGPAHVSYSAVRSIRGMADDDVVVVLTHDSGVDSYLSASAIVGAAGPRIRLMGEKAALVITELDPQEGLLRSGSFPAGGNWSEETRSLAQLHLGDEVRPYPAVPGNYAAFYLQVKAALTQGAAWPTSTDQALAVAQLIDQAREISVR